MNDYQLFPSMVETLREIIPFSQHRIVRGKSIVRIYDHEAEAFRTVDPVYVIDGIMTDNTEYLLSLNPSDLVSIKLVYKADKLREFGSIGDGGMFLVETKIPNNAVNVPRNEQTFLLQGLTKSISPGKITHSAGTRKTPDLRTNLVWIPNLSTDSNCFRLFLWL